MQCSTKRNTTLVLEIMQVKTTVAQRPATPKTLQKSSPGWTTLGTAWKTSCGLSPMDVREQYERQMYEFQQAADKVLLHASPARLV